MRHAAWISAKRHWANHPFVSLSLSKKKMM